MSALVIYQSESHGKIICFLYIRIFPEQDGGTYTLGFSPQGFFLIEKIDASGQQLLS